MTDVPLFTNLSTGDWPVLSGASLGAILYRRVNPRMESQHEGWRLRWEWVSASVAESIMIAGCVHALWVWAGGYPERYDSSLRQFVLSMVLSGLTGTGIFTFARMGLMKLFPKFFPPMPSNTDLTPTTGTPLPERKE
jgi:hypothetical protein